MRTTPIIIWLWLTLSFGTACAQISSVDAVSAELVSDTRAIHPGTAFYAGVKLSMAPGWHVNWINPGDAGLAPTIEWRLPDGFAAGDIEWPYPGRYELPGVTIFGYSGEVVLLTKIEVPGTVPPGKQITIGARVTWLACREACVPGEAELLLDIHVAGPTNEPSLGSAGDLRAALEKRPANPENWKVTASFDESSITLTIEPAESVPPRQHDNVLFYPIEQGIIENASPQEWKRVDRSFSLTAARARMGGSLPARLQGVLVSETGWANRGQKAFMIDTPLTGASN